MNQPLDKITEAYFNEMGTEFGQKTRDRIHWVCEQARGVKVLDVGCSQGITDIILGREGKEVFAIDVLEESINYAKNMLINESDETKKRVVFQTLNFMTHDFKDEKYDVIIFSEVLEHIAEPMRFLKKAEGLLSSKGEIIITIPFGINDFFDHKKTYYILDALEMIPETLKIKEFKFLVDWLGFTVKRDADGVDLYNLFAAAEESFYLKERSIIDNQNRLINRQNELITEKSNYTEMYTTAKGWHDKSLSIIETLTDKTNLLEKKLEKVISEKNEQVRMLAKEKRQHDKTLKKSEQLINEITELKSSNEKITSLEHEKEKVIKTYIAELKSQYEKLTDEEHQLDQLESAKLEIKNLKLQQDKLILDKEVENKLLKQINLIIQEANLESLKSHFKDLQDEKVANENLNTNYKELNSKHIKLTLEYKLAKEELDSLKVKYTGLQARYKNEKVALNQKIAQLEQKNKQYDRELSRITNSRLGGTAIKVNEFVWSSRSKRRKKGKK